MPPRVVANNYALHTFPLGRLPSRLRSRRPREPVRRESSWKYLQCAALDRTAALEQLGEIDADWREAGFTQLHSETYCGRGKHNMQAVGDHVQPECECVGASHD